MATLRASGSGLQSILIGVVFACAATIASGQELARSAELFQRACSVCHGERGDGRSLANTSFKTAPRDFTTEQARANLSREYMIAIVRDGRPHTAMVGRTARLDQAQVEGVVDFIRTAFMVPEPGTPLALGHALYRKSCASCHGDRGQGGAARGAIPASPPLSTTRARPGLTADVMVEAMSSARHAALAGASGAGLTADEARAAVAYIRTAFIENVAERRDTGAQKTQ